MDTTTSPGPLHCANCGELLARNPRLGGRQQRYCGKPACQRARKTGWQRRKYAADAAYREREKKRVRIFRRTHRIRSCRGQPPEAAVNTAGTARSFQALTAQLQWLRHQIAGLAAHATGIADADRLTRRMDAFAEEGRVALEGVRP